MARERNLATKTGINKQGWEESDFPIACESCYGTNSFMRMLKERYGQECRICFRPFTVFKWKGSKGAYKRTTICQACAKSKNLCQTCLADLQFGLPMQVRDRRCGPAGKDLLDSNFTNLDNTGYKPPLPEGPPPPPKADNIIILPPKKLNESSEDQQQQQQQQEVPAVGK